MNASELITKLQALIDAHGDQPLAMRDLATGELFDAQHMQPRYYSGVRIAGIPESQECIVPLESTWHT